MRVCSFVCCNGVCIYLVSAKTKFEWDTSTDIKWMKVPSLIQLYPNTWRFFLLSRYFLWRIKINNRPFLGCLSTKLMTILLKQTHFETNIFLSTKVTREREKRGFTSYLSALGGDRRLCLKIMPNRENEIYLWKMVFKVGMYSATYESVTVPVGRDKKIRTALRTNQFAGFVTVPSEKKFKRDMS